MLNVIAIAPPSRRIVVCADDYGLTPGVSRGIRELLAAQRISATSVMTGSEFWPEEAAVLQTVAGSADIGLHVTLTDQRPLGPMPTLAPDGRLPPLPKLFRAALARRLPLGEIEAEIERQLACFITHYGRPPAHIDGHHHTHQLPGIREIVVRVAARFGPPRPWVRNCAEPIHRIRRRGVAPLKAAIVGAFGPPTRRLADAAHVATNRGFSGVYDYRSVNRALAEIFARFLDGAGDGHLVMCHPGYTDAILAGRDSLTTGREAELAFLAGPVWPELLVARNLGLGSLQL